MSVKILSLTSSDYGMLYSFQSSVYSAMGLDYDIRSSWSTLGVYPTGCLTLDETSTNCTQACLEPATIWDSRRKYSTYTLQNCMVYPFISYMLRSGLLTDESATFVDSMGYLANPPSDLAEQGWPAISSCINAFCESSSATPGCKTDYQGLTSIPKAGNLYTHSFPLYDMYNDIISDFNLNFTTNICYGLEANVNPDLGGPGVFLSYLIQIGLAIGAWLNLRFQDSWTKYVVWAVKTPSLGARAAWEVGSGLQQRLHARKYRNALVASLKEFQAAQVFFMISIQIAVLFVSFHSNQYDANSWQALINNIGVLYDLALAGCVPVAFVMLILYVAGDRSAYATVVTASCVFLSGATWIFLLKSGNINPYEAISTHTQSFPEACGGAFSPIVYCVSGIWWLLNSSARSAGGLIVGFCWFVSLVLLLEYVRVFRRRDASHTADSHKRQNCYELTRAWVYAWPGWGGYEKAAMTKRYLHWLRTLGFDKREKVLAKVVAVPLMGMEFLSLALLCILLQNYLRIFSSSQLNGSFAFDWTAWSLGQVIAVTLWISVVFKYLWNTFVGVEKDDIKDEVEPKSPMETAYRPISDLTLNSFESQYKEPSATYRPVYYTGT